MYSHVTGNVPDTAEIPSQADGLMVAFCFAGALLEV